MSVIKGYLDVICVALAARNNNTVLTKVISEIWEHGDVVTENKNTSC